ncbi:blue-copper-binding protein [Prunus dulcis]|uniref:Blue-copper-binding protein n=1 Tax=Prunus dulcis TaxID=3755 RepID=A0A5H2XK71_PRUDU|nr:blue-copper-binding protein [Prunus dulcis]
MVTMHVVGDSLGWAIPQSGQQYVTWASANKFAVGDILIFHFATNEHDVQQVPKASFDSCNSDNAIGSSIRTGPANVMLTSAGDNYFICTYGTHCQSGQKLAITVSAAAPGASPSAPTSAPPPPLATTPPTTPLPSPRSKISRVSEISVVQKHGYIDGNIDKISISIKIE